MSKKVFGVAGGAAGIGGLAAALGTCCVAPWAVTLLGVSGAVTLARLASYQPYFIAVAAVLLGLGFYWAYRPDPACVDGSCEATQRTHQRWVLWIVAALLVLFTAISFAPFLI